MSRHVPMVPVRAYLLRPGDLVRVGSLMHDGCTWHARVYLVVPGAEKTIRGLDHADPFAGPTRVWIEAETKGGTKFADYYAGDRWIDAHRGPHR